MSTNYEAGKLIQCQTVIFDLDGTLVDSPIDFVAMRLSVIEEAAHAGVPSGTLSPEMTTVEILHRAREVLQPKGTDIPAFEQAVARRLDAIELDALPKAKEVPGARDALNVLQRQGINLGILTRSGDRYALRALRNTGLSPYFRVVTTRNSPGPAKPDPSSLRRTMEKMEAVRSQTVFVGDHGMDLDCARAASVSFIGIAWEAASRKDREEEFARSGGCPIVHSYPELLRALGDFRPA